MALMIQVEEREVVMSCIALLDRCQTLLGQLGEEYVPPDSKATPSVSVGDLMD
jgi:hypothetical protein